MRARFAFPVYQPRTYISSGYQGADLRQLVDDDAIVGQHLADRFKPASAAPIVTEAFVT